MKLTALTPFPIIPTHFGGAERCFNLLAQAGPIQVHALSWEGHANTVAVEHLTHTVTPASPGAIEQSRKLQQQGIVTFDAMPHMTRKHLQGFYDLIHQEEPDLIILEHPWLVDFVGETPFIYDAHNAETYSFGQRFGQGPEYLHIRDLERRAIEGAQHVTYCSEADAQIMCDMFGDFAGTHIPNGTDLPDLGTREKSNTLIFIGSVYQPNIDAAQRLVNMAPQLPDYQIVIAGPCSYWVNSNNCSNVTLLGPVSDETRHDLFLNAHAFVNPVTAGSGTHLKIARALAYGLPVITTALGARGYDDLIVTTIDAMPDAVREISKDYSNISSKARAQAQQLSWDTIGETFRQVIDATIQ